MKLIIFIAAVAVVTGERLKYIAIPLDEVEFLEMNDSGLLEMSRTRPSLVRIPRKTEVGPHESHEPTDESRVERQSGGHHPYVDYGAHTGHHGAFGWHADFPVHKKS